MTQAIFNDRRSRRVVARQRSTAQSSTRILLTMGAIAGPLYVTTSLVQAFTREGFNLYHQPFSLLSLTDAGWLQISNFVVNGLLFIAGAFGMRRVMTGLGRTWGPLLVGLSGVGMIGGGVFVPDPALGYPIGTPDAIPESISWHSALHGVAATTGFLSLIVGALVFARRFAKTGERGRFVYCAATCVVFAVAVVATSIAPDGEGVNLLLVIAIIAGMTWASAMAADARKTISRL